MLMRPFTATVDGNGNGLIVVQHDLSGIVWRIGQIGFALGELAPSPQVAAHLNGIPFVSSMVMVPSIFNVLEGQPPFAMEGVFAGPAPYPVLEAGDQIVCGVIGALTGDTFTAGVFYEELYSQTGASMLG